MEHFMFDSECRACGCTDFDCSNCVEKTGVPCYWVEDDLCSACVGDLKPVNVTFHFKDGKGSNQTMTFEMDITVGCDEEGQLSTACDALLLEKAFFNTSGHKSSYKFLKDIE